MEFCEGVFGFQPPRPQYRVMDFSQWPYNNTSNLTQQTDEHERGTNRYYRLVPCGPSSFSRGAPLRRSFMGGDSFGLLMNLLHISAEEQRRRRRRVNTRAGGGTEDSSGAVPSNSEDTSPKSDTSLNLSADATENRGSGKESADALKKSCKHGPSSDHNDVGSSCRNNNNNNNNKSRCKERSPLWQVRAHVGGCDQVKAFIESGVLKIEGQKQRDGSTTKVRHCIAMPSTVNPEALKCCVTRDGHVIVTESRLVKTGEEKKRSEQKEDGEEKTQEEEKQTHKNDEKSPEKKKEEANHQDSAQGRSRL